MCCWDPAHGYQIINIITPSCTNLLTVSHFEAVFQQLRTEVPDLTDLYNQTDNTSNYHRTQFFYQVSGVALLHGFRVLEIWENEPGEDEDLVDALFNQFKTSAKYHVSRTQTALPARTSVHLACCAGLSPQPGMTIIACKTHHDGAPALVWPTMVGIKQHYHITFPEPEWQLVPASTAAPAAPVVALTPARASASVAAHAETQLADAVSAGMALASPVGPAGGTSLTNDLPAVRSSLAEVAITAANVQLDAETLAPAEPFAHHVSCNQLAALLEPMPSAAMGESRAAGQSAQLARTPRCDGVLGLDAVQDAPARCAGALRSSCCAGSAGAARACARAPQHRHGQADRIAGAQGEGWWRVHRLAQHRRAVCGASRCRDACQARHITHRRGAAKTEVARADSNTWCNAHCDAHAWRSSALFASC